MRSAVSLGAVFLLLHLANSSDVLSGLTRPVVVSLLQFLGVQAEDRLGYIVLDRLQIPWTRDCAGLNVLTILWAVTLWVNRREKLSRRYWFRLVLALPVTFAANIGRVLTIIAYRHLFFPDVESPQLHYFIGFLWLLPFLSLFLPRQKRAFTTCALEALYLVATLSLSAPVVSSPGGSVVALCAVIWLADSRFDPTLSAARWLAFAAWGIAAGLIAVSSMESLWIPWLLLCPAFVSRSLLTSVYSVPFLLGTIPVLAMQRWAELLVFAVAAVYGWRTWHQRERLTDEAPKARSGEARPPVWSLPALALAIICPFILNSLGGIQRSRERPPAGVMFREIDANSYHIRLMGQPPDIDLTWYGPYGGGRHHTLKVCMRYRGVFLQPSGGPGDVLSDGQHWMREFFLQEGDLLLSYPMYVRRTFSPFSKPGIHLIATAPRKSMTATSFDKITEDLARQLQALQ